MKNIIRSINYETRKSKLLIGIYIAFILVMILITFTNVNVGNDFGTSEMFADNKSLPYYFSLFIVAFFVGIICCSDLKDRVINYEVMSGHSRKTVFLARGIYATVLAAVAGTILSVIPLVVGSAIFGWGNRLVMSDVLVRVLLLFFPYMRLAAFLVLLGILIKSPYIMMAIGYGLTMIPGIQEQFGKHSTGYALSLFNMNGLMDYKGWSVYNLDPSIGIVEYNSYNSAVPAGLVIGTIVVSLLMTALYIFIGYALFRRDELN